MSQELASSSIEAALKDWVINFPDSGQFSSGVGTNKFDFATGKISEYDGTNALLQGTLPSLGHKGMQTLYFWADQEATFIFRYKGQRTGRLNYDQCLTYDGVHIPFDYFEVEFDLPGTFEFVASTSLIPWTTQRIVSHQMRYSSGSSTDAFAAVQWQATELAGLRSSSSPKFTSATLHVPNIRAKSFLVFNTGSNDIAINLQGKNDAGSSNFADDPSTGASLTVPAGKNAVVVPSIPGTGAYVPYHFMRLLVKNVTAGSSSTYEIQYIGHT